MIVNSQNVVYSEDQITATYEYRHQNVEKQQDGKIIITPKTTSYTFKTNTKVPKLGILLVGWGGNNGTTFTAGILANKNKLSWQNKRGEQTANYYGSITQSSTIKVGCNGSEEVFLPMKDILPLVNPDDVIIGGWDINEMNLSDAMRRAQVLDYNLIEKVSPYMQDLVPMKSVYYEDFIAANQKDRATNILEGNDKQKHLETIRKDIREFKEKNKCEKVIVLWTANTERFCEIKTGVHDTAENVLKAIENSDPEISASTIYAVASLLEGSSYINGSPQNTLVPGVIQLAKMQDVFIVGDDFKSGQTKMKTSLTDFLVTAGIKPMSIVSYNHLGNNDGKNLASERQFKSKELSKKSCVDDILASNKVLYPKTHKIDHEIVIKYVPYTGDSKKAMDEYISEIFLGGQNTIVMYNVCEDSLLAAPIILDLILLTELFERIDYQVDGMRNFSRFNRVLSTLGYLCKAPLTDQDTPHINSLFRQKTGLDNIFRACAGLQPDDNTLLEFKCPVV
ncbi:myo-inositol-1-phosphate synthase, putative [Ichthyophthirius multifiliis]|uniref:Inositol-3-phosphate synthase n=1 Tax=Ichthyophthirius multifiliis TaxID=5932 RepID=G0QPU0_ICHMU|nr:myo-inositol-1-phosphate synthase, putative [Ichthyophthirius multifiliis]EGR32770.1 myo-inositol-1-phosphate synthase, putative [Ichthyophthirius multifiliis]|eukprot:XP_004036756.1 myo-inositol-1-phosphate synthase, putative [Ichthyophthirius multifiliis]